MDNAKYFTTEPPAAILLKIQCWCFPFRKGCELMLYEDPVGAWWGLMRPKPVYVNSREHITRIYRNFNDGRKWLPPLPSIPRSL